MTAPDSSESSLDEELTRLETIVRQLEATDLQLDDALRLFEDGVARLRAARERLASAEVRIQQVLQNASGDLEMTDLDL